MKRKPVIHRALPYWDRTAVCGVEWSYSRMTWRGVTCKNCLKMRKGKKEAIRRSRA